MNKQGLATASAETTEAPTMYREIEQAENVARGCVEIVEVIAYDTTKRAQRHLPDRNNTKGVIKKDKDGKTLYEEDGRKPYYCQDPSDVMIFKDNNPNARIETFTIQLRKKTAIEALNSPRNMKQFKEAS